MAPVCRSPVLPTSFVLCAPFASTACVFGRTPPRHASSVVSSTARLLMAWHGILCCSSCAQDDYRFCFDAGWYDTSQPLAVR